jgi:hypothetical protein
MKNRIVSALLISFSFLIPSISHGNNSGGWSAIAYDPSTGLYGYAAGAFDKQQAENASINSCNSQNCKVVVSVHNGHAALVVGNNNNDIYGSGFAPTKFEAMYWAMYHCNKSPSSCRVLVAVTSHD